MRSYGEIAEIYFTRKKYCIRNLAYEYVLTDGYDTTITVYVNSMKELKDEIRKFKEEVAQHG